MIKSTNLGSNNYKFMFGTHNEELTTTALRSHTLETGKNL